MSHVSWLLALWFRAAALGATVPELGIAQGEAYPKTKFSMLIDEVQQDLAKEPERKDIVLFG